MDPASPLPLHGDYEYLGEGYYALQTYEDAEADPAFTCADALDAYVVPIALERARLAGLATPPWYLTNEYFEPPALLYGVNPFARAFARVDDPAEAYETARRMSRNGKFVVLVQELAPDARLVEFEMVFGASPDAEWSAWAADVYRVFRLPLARVRLVVQDGAAALSALERLPRRTLTPAAQTLLLQHADGRADARG